MDPIEEFLRCNEILSDDDDDDDDSENEEADAGTVQDNGSAFCVIESPVKHLNCNHVCLFCHTPFHN